MGLIYLSQYCGFSLSGCVPSMVGWSDNGGLERSWKDAVGWYCPGSCLNWLRKTRKARQCDRCPRGISNRLPLICKYRTLPLIQPAPYYALPQNCEKQPLVSSCVFDRPSHRPPAHLPRTTLFPLDGFSWNLIFEYFSKHCRENSGFIKIWQE